MGSFLAVTVFGKPTPASLPAENSAKGENDLPRAARKIIEQTARKLYSGQVHKLLVIKKKAGFYRPLEANGVIKNVSG